MKKTYLYTTLCFALILVACQKETIEPNKGSSQTNVTANIHTPGNSANQPQGETFASLAAYLNSKTVNAETFSINAGSPSTLNTAKGSVLYIPANAFIDQAGNLVTGNVDIKIKEIFSTADIMFSEVYPVAFNNVLNSGGEYFLEARQNNTVLRVDNGAFINLEIPAQALDPNMELFFGGADENAAVNWEPVDSAQNGANNGNVNGFTFNTSNNAYNIILDSLCWGNIDAFMWNVTYFDCSFNLTGLSNLDNSNTTAFAVFKDENTVWPVGTASWGGISGNLITESHLADIDMNIVVISVVDEQLYYGLLDVIPADNQTYDIPMISTTSENLDNIISSLP